MFDDFTLYQSCEEYYNEEYYEALKEYYKEEESNNGKE